jgi:F-type H+-transporting ATPase subunit b
MKQIRWVSLVTSVLFVFLFAAVTARAAEESGGSAGAQTTTEIFKWINFAIVIGAIVWVFAKALPPRFRSNAESISYAITKATAAREEAERLLREAEMKLANLQKEVAELRAEAERESAAEVERIRAVTKSDMQKITVAAKAEIEAAERAARVELKSLAAKLAVDGAESLLAKQLTPTAQESLVSVFVKSLEARPN